jgi:hypothetical protein
MPKTKVGDIITYQSGGTTRKVRVEHSEDNIKNGYPGFSGTCIECDKLNIVGDLVWGYDSQIMEIKHAEK